MPLTVSLPPWPIFASVNWRPDASDTPGTPWIVATASLGIGAKLFEVMIRSLVRERSSAPRNEFLNPFTNTATNTTRATPIISDDDVTAVRLGLRIVFSRARRLGMREGPIGGQVRRVVRTAWTAATIAVSAATTTAARST